ncbi:hypothetical protein Tco_1460941, partial [Tanacetum coccineum]
FQKKSFDKMVEDSWKNSNCMESNSIIKLKKKLQALKTLIKQWLTEDKLKSNVVKLFIQNRLSNLDRTIDQGRCKEEIVYEISKLLKEIQDLNSFTSLDITQKAKILEGDWIVKPSNVKKEFLNHLANRFSEPVTHRLIFETQYPNRLSSDYIEYLEINVSYDETKRATWDYGINKSPSPDGFTFEFFRRYWNLIDQDAVAAFSLSFLQVLFPEGVILHLLR